MAKRSTSKTPAKKEPTDDNTTTTSTSVEENQSDAGTEAQTSGETAQEATNASTADSASDSGEQPVAKSISELADQVIDNSPDEEEKETASDGESSDESQAKDEENVAPEESTEPEVSEEEPVTEEEVSYESLGHKLAAEANVDLSKANNLRTLIILLNEYMVAMKPNRPNNSMTMAESQRKLYSCYSFAINSQGNPTLSMDILLAYFRTYSNGVFNRQYINRAITSTGMSPREKTLFSDLNAIFTKIAESKTKKNSLGRFDKEQLLKRLNPEFNGANFLSWYTNENG